jgi:hypothetical protein
MTVRGGGHGVSGKPLTRTSGNQTGRAHRRDAGAAEISCSSKLNTRRRMPFLRTDTLKVINNPTLQPPNCNGFYVIFACSDRAISRNAVMRGLFAGAASVMSNGIRGVKCCCCCQRNDRRRKRSCCHECSVALSPAPIGNFPVNAIRCALESDDSIRDAASDPHYPMKRRSEIGNPPRDSRGKSRL